MISVSINALVRALPFVRADVIFQLLTPPVEIILCTYIPQSLLYVCTNSFHKFSLSVIE